MCSLNYLFILTLVLLFLICCLMIGPINGIDIKQATSIPQQPIKIGFK